MQHSPNLVARTIVQYAIVAAPVPASAPSPFVAPYEDISAEPVGTASGVVRKEIDKDGFLT